MRQLTATSIVIIAALGAACTAHAAPVVDGNARFTVITPSLIRLEYAADRAFDDDRTQVTDGKLPSNARFVTTVRRRLMV